MPFKRAALILFYELQEILLQESLVLIVLMCRDIKVRLFLEIILDLDTLQDVSELLRIVEGV